MKWRIEDIGKFLRNSLVAIVRGEFLLRLNIGRYFVHILFTFLLFGLAIWISLMIDSTLSKVEYNNAVIKELKIVESQKEYQLMTIRRRSKVADMLSDMKSEVKEPEKPAARIR